MRKKKYKPCWYLADSTLRNDGGGGRRNHENVGWSEIKVTNKVLRSSTT
jgi:hypothetical protein